MLIGSHSDIERRIARNRELYGSFECLDPFSGARFDVPIQNEFGKNYPTYATSNVHQLFNVEPGDLVVDIGGGYNPLMRADIVVDKFPGSTVHRHLPLKIHPHQRLVVADAEALPFKDKSIDFVFTQQTFEHLPNPAKGCEELMRVAKRGFIDVPRAHGELHNGSPEHLWLIDYRDGVLMFVRKPDVKFSSPLLQDWAYRAFTLDRKVARYIEYYYPNVSAVQVYWEDGFKYKVYEKW